MNFKLIIMLSNCFLIGCSTMKRSSLLGAGIGAGVGFFTENLIMSENVKIPRDSYGFPARPSHRGVDQHFISKVASKPKYKNSGLLLILGALAGYYLGGKSYSHIQSQSQKDFLKGLDKNMIEVFIPKSGFQDIIKYKPKFLKKKPKKKNIKTKPVNNLFINSDLNDLSLELNKSFKMKVQE